VLSVSFGTSLDGIPCQKVAVAPALNTSVDPDHGHGCTSLQSLTRATFVFWGFIKINRIRMTENRGQVPPIQCNTASLGFSMFFRLTLGGRLFAITSGIAFSCLK
jgi:hypothetical protein